MGMQVVLATRNRDKLKEIRKILAPFAIRVVSLARFPGAPEVEEDGRTLEENAAKKALAIARFTGKLTLSDDTGLEVDVLRGRPGVRSARFAGPKASYRENYEKLLCVMRKVPQKKRGAAFRCVVAVASPDRLIKLCQGNIRGRITREPAGKGGFGYDPVFWVPRLGKTFSEVSPAVKNQISHRARAFRKAGEYLRKSGIASSRLCRSSQ